MLLSPATPHRFCLHVGSAATQVTQCGVFTPISAAPAPQCHHRLHSRSQLMGPREQGTVAGKAPTTGQTCPHAAEGTPRIAPLAMRGCLAPAKTKHHIWMLSARGTRVPSAPPADLQTHTKKQAESVQNLSSANPSGRLKWNIPPADTGQQLPARSDHQNTP